MSALLAESNIKANTVNLMQRAGLILGPTKLFQLCIFLCFFSVRAPSPSTNLTHFSIWEYTLAVYFGRVARLKCDLYSPKGLKELKEQCQGGEQCRFVSRIISLYWVCLFKSRWTVQLCVKERVCVRTLRSNTNTDPVPWAIALYLCLRREVNRLQLVRLSFAWVITWHSSDAESVRWN